MAVTAQSQSDPSMERWFVAVVGLILRASLERSMYAIVAVSSWVGQRRNGGYAARFISLEHDSIELSSIPIYNPNCCGNRQDARVESPEEPKVEANYQTML